MLKVLALLALQQSWSVESRPAVRIGEVDGAPEYMFSGVSGAVRLSDGRIVIADSLANNIRVYDANGKHVSTLGRTGSGPGEYQRLRALWLAAGDSLFAYDMRSGRVTVYSSAPVMVTTLPLAGSATVNGRLADGSFIATVGVAPPEKIKDFRGEVDYNGFVLRRMAGAVAGAYDTIARGKAGQSFVQPLAQGFRQYPFPYGRTAQIAIGRNRFYYGNTHSTEIGVYDREGKQTGTVRIRGSARALSAADIEKWIEHQAASRPTEQAKQDTRTALREIPPTRRTPEFSALRLDAAENLWVRRYGPPWEPSPEWDVYDPSGRAAATLRLPMRFEPLHLGNDFILGVTKDELDVERVELYRLRRGR